jgi:hypothetical protein
MKLDNIGPNQTILTFGKDEVFFSYSTPVAALFGGKFYRTEKKWSVTTSKHINQWLADNKAEKKPQKFFDELIEGNDEIY